MLRPSPARLLTAVLAALVLTLTACSSGAGDPSGPSDPSVPASDPASAAPSESPAEPPSESPSESPSGSPSNGQQYVALGDSYTSAPYVPTTDPDDGCLRSSGNYPHLVSDALGYALDDVSCAGATSASMVGVQQTATGETATAQFDAIKPGTDLVTLGIGGNDIGLFATLGTCLTLAETDPTGSPCADQLRGTPKDLMRQVRGVEGRIAAIVNGVRDRAAKAQVIVVTYPQLFPETGTCDALPLAEGDYAYLRAVNTALSRSMEAGAKAEGADVVDVLSLSKGHSVCSDDPWVNGIQNDPQAALALHPFAEEQQAVADEIEQLVGNRGKGRARA